LNPPTARLNVNGSTVDARQIERMDVRPPLKIGLVIDPAEQPNWLRRLVMRLADSPYARFELVIELARPGREGWLTRLTKDHPYLLYHLYQRLDQFLYRGFVDRTAIPTVVEQLGAAPVLRLKKDFPIADGSFSPDELRKVKELNLDLILCFSAGTLPRALLDSTRRGIWSIQHPHPWAEWNEMGFWEVLRHEATTYCELRETSAVDGRGRAVFESFFSTHLESALINRKNYFSRISTAILRQLRALWEEGRALSPPGLSNGHFPSAPIRTPTNRRLALPLLRLGFTILTRKLERKLYHHQWFLAFSFDDTSTEPGRMSGSYRKMIPPSDRFWADPFPVYREGKYYIFFEELLFKTGKGHISVTELQKDGSWSTPTIILDQAQHLSYPFIFKWQGSYYLIPETHARRTIELYRCLAWPHRWELEKVLLSEINASDATVCEIEGMWWMFAAVAAEGTKAKDELSLFFAKSPLGPWIPHAKNPVVSDVRRARPAGRVYQSDKAWIRPAQDCAGPYGRGIVMLEILRLTPQEYAEEKRARIDPYWSKRMVGTHTWNREGELTVIDGCRRSIKPIQW
jgi:hypothetical protein